MYFFMVKGMALTNLMLPPVPPTRDSFLCYRPFTGLLNPSAGLKKPACWTLTPGYSSGRKIIHYLPEQRPFLNYSATLATLTLARYLYIFLPLTGPTGVASDRLSLETSVSLMSYRS